MRNWPWNSSHPNLSRRLEWILLRGWFLAKETKMGNLHPPLGKLNSQKIAPYVFIAPAVIYIFIATLIPVIMALPISVTNWSALSPHRKFVGFDNYRRLMGDARFWKSCLVMAQFFIYVPLVMVLGLIAAMLLNTHHPGVKLFRVVYYAPVITSTAAAAILFDWFFQPTFGLFNAILAFFHFQGIGWVSDAATAVPSVILFKLWKGFGECMLIYLAGLQDIGGEVMEAASIDGANTRQRFFRITLPLLKPAHTYLLLTNIIKVFMIFQETYVLEGPLDSTKTVVNYIYKTGFESFKMGYASAMSFVLFVIVMVITVVQQRISKLDLA
jgi:multiple sugar transport system permease protein